MPERPTGTVTFLFTDIEGSTRLWEQYPEPMKAAVAQHDALLRQAVEKHAGYVVKTTGDGLHAAFGAAHDALAAALAAQYSLARAMWSETGPLRVRMGLHTGPAQERDDDYFGPALNRAARVMAVGYGSQILLSDATYQLVRDRLPDGVNLRDMGECRLRDLGRPEHIFQVVAPDLPADFPLLKCLDAARNNLPRQPTPFIGRKADIERARQLFLDPNVQLVTFVGPGGIGKTRLALQVAAEAFDAFPDGVFFVDLALVADAAFVVPAIAQALDISEVAGRLLRDTLVDEIGDKRMLLILDSFEAVRPPDKSAQIVADLRAACVHLKLAVTSRTVLHLRGERDFHVEPLALPSPVRAGQTPPSDYATRLADYDAVRLFVARAQETQADFGITNANASDIASICRRLDGLPLAIELAAARLNMFTPQALLQRLNDALNFLTTGDVDMPERQRTIRACIAWSYNLLDAQEKMLFRRLAVFAGGCTAASAEALYSVFLPSARPSTKKGRRPATLARRPFHDLLASLIDNSLLRTQGQPDGEPRFSMLEIVREYARERLASDRDAEAIHRHHAEHYIALAEQANEKRRGPQQVEALNRLEREHDNLRAVLQWCLEASDRGGPALRLGTALWTFWDVRGYWTEGRQWLARVRAYTRQAKRIQIWARLLNGEGSLAMRQSDYASAHALIKEGLALYRELGDKAGIAAASTNSGNVAYSQGDYASAHRLYAESLALYRELGDKGGIASASGNLGNLAGSQGDYASARAHFKESLALSRELGDKRGIASASANLGSVAYSQGDYASARTHYEESLALSCELGDKVGIASGSRRLGSVAYSQGDYASAHRLYAESLTLSRDLEEKAGIASALGSLGNVAYSQGDYASARAHHKEALALHRELGNKEGIAIALGNLAHVERRQEQASAARRLMMEGLTLARASDAKEVIAYLLASFAAVCADGQPERAVRLLGAADALRQSIGVPVAPLLAPEYDDLLAAERAQLGDERFAALYVEGEAMTQAQALDYALEEGQSDDAA